MIKYYCDYCEEEIESNKLGEVTMYSRNENLGRLMLCPACVEKVAKELLEKSIGIG